MDTTTNSTPSNANGISEENQEGQVSPTLSKEVGGGNAKEGGGSKKPQNADVDVLCWAIGNPENRKEYVWVSPEDYREGKPFAEYLDKYRPIVAP